MHETERDALHYTLTSEEYSKYLIQIATYDDRHIRLLGIEEIGIGNKLYRRQYNEHQNNVLKHVVRDNLVANNSDGVSLGKNVYRSLAVNPFKQFLFLQTFSLVSLGKCLHIYFN